MRLLIAILASVTLLITEYRSERLLPVRATLSVLTDSLKYAVDLPVSLFEKFSETLTSYETLKTENNKLRPVTSISRIVLPGYALPISFLIFSAVVSPINVP